MTSPFAVLFCRFRNYYPDVAATIDSAVADAVCVESSLVAGDAIMVALCPVYRTTEFSSGDLWNLTATTADERRTALKGVYAQLVGVPDFVSTVIGSGTAGTGDMLLQLSHVTLTNSTSAALYDSKSGSTSRSLSPVQAAELARLAKRSRTELVQLEFGSVPVDTAVVFTIAALPEFVNRNSSNFGTVTLWTISGVTIVMCIIVRGGCAGVGSCGVVVH